MKYLKILPLIIIIATFACKKSKKDPRVPPDVKFKTGGKYISSDKTVNKGDTLLVGIIATKVEDDLKSYNISYAYDGATSTTTFYNYFLNSSEYQSYSKDTAFYARNQLGSEKWIFSVVDRDGNITQKSITLTVQ